jgi:hypothetical protein
MSSFNASKIRKAIEEFTPQRPEQFQELIAAKGVIIELRKKRASYRSIADLLTRHCLPTSKTSVAVFCHKILGENVRSYRRPASSQPQVAEVQSVADAVPVSIPSNEGNQAGNAGQVETSPVRPRGPRIAQIRLAKPPSPTP